MSAGRESLRAALEQAIASASVVCEGELGAMLTGDTSTAKIVGYQVGAKEWEALVAACRSMTARGSYV